MSASDHLAPGYLCEACGFQLWVPVARLGISHLGLYDDARFPGRCLLVLDDHHEALEALEPELAHRFLDDAQRAARAISTAVRADRMNFAVLGNAAPHVHFHLIPRVFGREPHPNRSPWSDGRSVVPLAVEDRANIIERIRLALGAAQNL